MGHRLEVYTDELTAEAIVATSRNFGIEAQIIGRVEATDGPSKVTVAGPHGTYSYT
jgi:phosphoribosylformylglycinamidine cyclo-ligase